MFTRVKDWPTSIAGVLAGALHYTQSAQHGLDAIAAAAIALIGLLSRGPSQPPK